MPDCQAGGIVTGLKASLIADIRRECSKQGLIMPEQQAYVLATVEHETAGTMQPVREAYYLGAGAEAYRRRLPYWPYYGRGLVQLTWRRNYDRYSKILGINLVAHPDEALKPDIARFILVHGFKHGVFTGKKITDYIHPGHVDFVNARRCINGLDKCTEIAALAKKYL